MNKLLLLVVGMSLIPMLAHARVTCKAFSTHAEAQAYYNARKPGYKSLDRDRDGSACDCLPGGNGRKCPKRR